MASCTISCDLATVVNVVEHCKRITTARESDAPAPQVAGYLMGSFGKNGVVSVNAFLPSQTQHAFKRFVAGERVGWYSTESMQDETLNKHKAPRMIFLRVALPSAAKPELGLTGMLCEEVVHADETRTYKMKDAAIVIQEPSPLMNVLLGSTMPKLFPEMEQFLQSRDPLSVESYTNIAPHSPVAQRTLDDFADRSYVDELPADVDVARLEKQLAALEGPKVKTTPLGQQIAEQRANVRKCLAELSAAGHGFADDLVTDTLVTKYIAALTQKKAAMMLKNAEEGTDVHTGLRSVQTEDSRYNAYGRGNNRKFGGRGGYRGRGGRGRGGGRGGRGRGAAQQ